MIRKFDFVTFLTVRFRGSLSRKMTSKKLQSRGKVFIFSFFLLSMVFVHAKDSNYAIAVGGKDKDRLTVLCEIYNSSSEEFFVACPIMKGDKVLELGSGIGLVAEKLAEIVGESGHVLGIDISEEQLAIAKDRLLEKPIPQLEYKRLSVYDLDKLDEKFDVVYVRFLLVHLPNPQRVIQLVKSVLKPDGKLFIEDLTGNETLFSVPNKKGMEIVQYFDELQFEVQESDDKYFKKVPELLENAGYKVLLERRRHPKLDTPRKRTMLSYNLSSLKEALISAGKMTEKEYEKMYAEVKAFEKDTSVDIYSYELGQICAQYSPISKGK